jgi:hypothetical protein
MQRAENERQIWDTAPAEYSLEHMARSLVESGDYRVTSRLEPQAEYHRPDNIPKLVAAVVDVETTGINPDHDKIIELGICLFEYDRQNGRIYKVLGTWEWFEDPGFSIPPEITKITGITDEMVTGHRIDERALNDVELDVFGCGERSAVDAPLTAIASAFRCPTSTNDPTVLPIRAFKQQPHGVGVRPGATTAGSTSLYEGVISPGMLTVDGMLAQAFKEGAQRV